MKTSEKLEISKEDEAALINCHKNSLKAQNAENLDNKRKQDIYKNRSMKSLINIAREEQIENDDQNKRLLKWNDQKSPDEKSLKDLVYKEQVDGAKKHSASFNNHFFENKKPVSKKQKANR